MTVEGSLDMFQLPEILQVVAQQQKTGILTVQGEQDIIAVSFLKGGVVGADSLNQTGDDGLVSVLQKSGHATAERLTQLQRDGERIGRSLQEMLLERNVLSQKQLLEALRTHYMELLGHLLTWREGDFKFYGNDEVSFEEGLAPISVQDILLRHITLDEGPAGAPRKAPGKPPPKPPPKPPGTTGTLPEIPDLLSDSLPSLGTPKAVEPRRPSSSARSTPLAPLTPSAPVEEEDSPKLALVYRRLPSSRPIKVRTTGGGGFDEGFIVLTLVEQRVLQQVDGERSLGQIGRELEIPEESSLAAARRLEELRLIRPAGATGELPTGVDFPEAEIGDGSRGLEDDREATATPAAPLDLSGAFAWACRGLGCLAVVALLWAVVARPSSVLLPFPWQQHERLALEKQQRTAAFLKADRAVKTFVLMSGRFPQSLTELTDLRLLSAEDLRTPQGLPLTYQASDLQYTMTPTRAGQPLPELSAAEAITGNFLLDYDFFSVAQGPAEQPLILLD